MKDLSYLTLSSELWGVYWEEPRESWMALHFHILPSAVSCTQWAMGCLLGSIAQRIMNGAPLSSGFTPVTLWVLCCPKQVSQTGISNCIPQYSVGCNYLSLPEIPASGTKVLIYLWDAITYPCWRYLLLVPKSSYIVRSVLSPYALDVYDIGYLCNCFSDMIIIYSKCIQICYIMWLCLSV